MELFRQSGAKNPGIKTPKLPTQLNQTTHLKISTSTKLINNQDHQPMKILLNQQFHPTLTYNKLGS